jgi:hypothetical protein
MVSGRPLRLGVVGAVVAIGIVGMAFVRPIAQDPRYHAFADARTIAGIPNFWNVVSNLGFVAVGLGGVWWLARAGRTLDRSLPERWERIAAGTFTAGIALIGAGSAFYHWAPDDDRLVWDRLPMTLVFMSLAALVVGDRVGAATGRRLLGPLLAVGLASVIVWHLTGDLRLYALVQFLPLLVIPLLLILVTGRYTGAGWLWATLGLNGLGKFAELADAGVLHVLLVSGHTMKHVSMAVATALVLRMLAVRRPR